jgi:hypothetical protein
MIFSPASLLHVHTFKLIILNTEQENIRLPIFKIPIMGAVLSDLKNSIKNLPHHYIDQPLGDVDNPGNLVAFDIGFYSLTA